MHVCVTIRACLSPTCLNTSHSKQIQLLHHHPPLTSNRPVLSHLDLHTPAASSQSHTFSFTQEMSSEGPAEPTIRSLFDSADKKRKSLDSFFDSNSDEYQDKLNAAISELEQCKDLISRASLFSMNEGLEEVATGDLR